MTSAELLAERKWTEFLKSLSFGLSDWTITDYRDFISLRTVASIMGNKEDCEKTFSIKQSKREKTVYIIDVKLKSDGND